MRLPPKQLRLAQAIVAHGRDTFAPDLLDTEDASAWALRGLRERGLIDRIEQGGLWSADLDALRQAIQTDTAAGDPPGDQVPDLPATAAAVSPYTRIHSNGDLLLWILHDGPQAAADVASAAGCSLRTARWRLRRMGRAGLLEAIEDDGLRWASWSIDDDEAELAGRARRAGFPLEAPWDGCRNPEPQQLRLLQEDRP